MLRLNTWIGLAALATQLAWVTPVAAADEMVATADGDTDAQTQAYAGERLQAMATWLAGLNEYSVKMRAAYDVLQESGQKIEFGERRKVSVKRPDKARIEQVASDGRRDLLLFDGEHITVLDATSNVFAQAPAPGEDLDDAINYLLESLKLRLPLASLLMASFPQELRRHVIEADLVETTDFMGPTTDHIAARTQQVDFQVWISQGDQPWPLRIVISYRLLPEAPQFWANLTDWDSSPDFTRETFVFKQPPGATRIPFAAQFLTEATVEQVNEAASEGAKP